MNNLRRLTAVNAVFYLATGLGAPLINLYLQQRGASYAQISLVMVLWVLTSIAVSTVYGRFSHRLGPRRYWLVGGVLLQSAAFLLLAQGPGLVLAATARVIEGMGVGLYATVSLAIVGELMRDSKQKGRQMGIYRGLGSLTFAVGALSGGRIAEGAAIEAVFYVEAVCFAIAALVATTLEAGPRPLPVLTSSLQAVVSARTDPTRQSTRTALPRAFLAGAVLTMASVAAASSMFPNYLSSLGRSYASIGGLWALAAALELPVMYGTGRISDRTGRPPILAAGAIASALYQLLYIVAARLPSTIVVAQGVRAFGFASYTANSMTFTAEISSEEDRALNSGVYNVAQNSGQLLGVGVGGILAQLFGFNTLFVTCALASLAASGAFLYLGNYRRGQPGREM